MVPRAGFKSTILAVRRAMGEAGAIIVYRLPPGITAARRVRFGEKVWGQTRTSYGRSSRRHGSLEGIPHWKVSRGVVLVRAQDRLAVTQELQRWRAEVEWWSVILTPPQQRKLKTRLG